MKYSYWTRALGMLLALVASSLAPFGKTHAQCTAEGGAIAFADGSTTQTIVIDDVPDPLDVTLDGNQVGTDFAWLITDEAGVILALPSGPPFDLNGAGTGTCLIWYLSFEGKIQGLEEGENAAGITGCTDLSNSLTVVREAAPPAPDAGAIAFADGSTTQDVCIVEGAGGTVAVQQTGTPVGQSQTYVITDDSGTILGIPGGGGPFDLSGAGAGTCNLYYLSYNGTITGLMAGMNVSGLSGDFALSAPIAAVRSAVDGGTIAFTDGSTTQTITVDGTADPLAVQQTGTPTGSNFAFVITDADANILALPAGNGPFDLDGAGVGTCLIWYLAFEDGLGGAAVGNNASDLTGCFDLSNPLTVVREAVVNPTCDAVAATLTPTATPVVLDASTVTISATVATAAVVPADYENLYVLTMGDDLVIQAVAASPSFDVSMTGSYRIHSLVANTDVSTGDDDNELDLSVVTFGTTTAQAVLDLVAANDICASLDVSGAQIVVTDPDPTCTAMAGTLTADNPSVQLAGGSATLTATQATPATASAPFAEVYVLTMGDDLVIQGVSATPSFDVSMAGTYRIHSFVANLTDPNGDSFIDAAAVVTFGTTTAQQVLDLVAANDLCASLDVMGAMFTVSDAGTPCTAMAVVPTADATSVALTDGSATISATLTTSPVVPDDYELTFVLTMGDDLVIQAVSATPSFTVEMAGDYRIHTLVANTDVSDGNDDNQLDLSVVTFGTTTAQDVLDLVFANDICASLDARGALIQVTDGTTGPSCDIQAGTLTPDNPNVTLDGSSVTLTATQATAAVVEAPFAEVYVLTMGDDLVIQAVSATPSFDVSMAGTYRIHSFVANLSDPSARDYIDAAAVVTFGTTTAQQVLDLVAANDICASLDVAGALFTVSTGGNTGVNGGTVTGLISTPDGRNLVGVCDGDDGDDDDDNDDGSTVTAQLNYATPVGQVAYVLTDASFVILEIQDSPTFDFSDNAPGKYHIWAFNYTGDITGAPGESVFSTQFSTADWTISQNCIVVNIGDGCAPAPDAGTIAFADGSTSQDVCIVEGSGGMVSVQQTGTPVGQNQTYLITDDNGTILGIPGGSGPFDLSGAGAGTCLVWYLTYNGTITGLTAGANAADLAGDFSLSNSISAVRSAVDGGTIAFADGSTTATITVDGTPDPLDVQQTGTPTGSNFTFVITDSDGNILGLPSGNGPFDLDGAGVGTCLIWYLAFEDGLTGAAVGNNASDLGGCFDLSNPLTVVREAGPTGVVTGCISPTEGASPVSVCDDHSNGASSVTVSLDYATNTGSVAYLMTDPSGTILSIQDSPTFDFGNRAAGEVHLWAVNYTGNFIAAVGQRAFGRLSDAEFLISQCCIVVFVGDNCPPPPPFTFTAAPISGDEFVIRRPAAELVTGDAELVSLRISTSTGRLVNSVDGVPAAALESYLMDVNGNGAGVYFVTVIRAGEVITEEVVFQ